MVGTHPEPRRRSLLPAIAAGVVALGLVVLLSVLLYSRAHDALEERSELQVQDATGFAALLVEEQMRRFSELVKAHAVALDGLADKPITSLDAAQRRTVRRELEDLHMRTRGVRSAGLVAPDGRILLTVPPAPEVYGRSFAFRDWHRGVTEERSPYVSRVFRAVTGDRPKTVTVAALVGPEDEPVAIVTATIERRTQELVTRLSRTQDLGIVVTDQGGDVVAASGVSSDVIRSERADPHVDAALRGESGTASDDETIASYAPVPDIGWTVHARLPADVALAEVHDLRSLAIVLTGVIWLLLGALTAAVVAFQRRAQKLATAAAERRRAIHLHDGVVQMLIVAQAARQAGDDEAADAAVARALDESKRITAELLPDNVGPGDLVRPDDPATGPG